MLGILLHVAVKIETILASIKDDSAIMYEEFMES